MLSQESQLKYLNLNINCKLYNDMKLEIVKSPSTGKEAFLPSPVEGALLKYGGLLSFMLDVILIEC